MNLPDGYRLLLIDNSLVKLFRSFDGAFAIAEQWMLNSGCTKIIPVDDYYQVYGYSGSIYTIHKEQGHLNSYTSSVLRGIVKKLEDAGVPVREISLQEAVRGLEENNG
jgi:hypothetical protein